MAILLGLVKKNPASDEWDGKIYDAKHGHIWAAKVFSAKPEELEVNGCFGICMGETWKRPPATGPGSIAEGAKVPAATTSTNPNVMTSPGAKMAPAVKGSAAPKPGITSPVAAGDIGDVCALPEVAAGIVP